MFIIKKCYDDGSGNIKYNNSSIIGIYDNYKQACEELIQKLQKMEYTFEIEDIYKDNYFFVKMDKKNNKDIYNGLCFEIEEKKININELKMK